MDQNCDCLHATRCHDNKWLHFLSRYEIEQPFHCYFKDVESTFLFCHSVCHVWTRHYISVQILQVLHGHIKNINICHSTTLIKVYSTPSNLLFTLCRQMYLVKKQQVKPTVVQFMYHGAANTVYCVSSGTVLYTGLVCMLFCHLNCLGPAIFFHTKVIFYCGKTINKQTNKQLFLLFSFCLEKKAQIINNNSPSSIYKVQSIRHCLAVLCWQPVSLSQV